jgi:site-specific recombinase XerD
MKELIPFASHSHNHIFTLIDTANLAPSTKEKYRRVIDAYLADGGQLTDRSELAAYAQTLSQSRRAHLKAAVKLWTRAMSQETKSMATPDNLAIVDAAIHRLQALQTAVTVPASKGEKTHTWLSRPEVVELMSLTKAVAGIKGERDRLALALLVGAGLRREEAVSLTFADVKQQPVKERVRTVLQVQGKGAKNRTLPVSDKLAQLITSWTEQVGDGGTILRSISKGGQVGEALSAVGLFKIVRRYGRSMGKPALAPHDLRRTYAQIGYESGVPITQISKLLGHDSVATTQRYLNLDLDLETTISDFVPI